MAAAQPSPDAAGLARSLRPVQRPAGLTAGGGQIVQVPSAAALIRAAKLGGHVAFAVADAKSGLMLESNEADLAQPPASVTKSVTALYALDALGPDYRFVTRLIATGPVQGGVLNGDLVLAGGGDPTLDTDDLGEMAQQLKAAGVQRVAGQFLVWGGALPYFRQIDPSQPDHVGYNPAISGLGLNYNRVHFEWKRGGDGWITTMDARGRKYRPEVQMARVEIKDRSLPVYTYKEVNGQDRWTVASKALGKGGARWLPVRQPAIYAGEVFRSLARAQGISMKAPRKSKAVPHGDVLVRHRSRDLRSVLRLMLKYSNNYTAELVGLTATLKRGGNATSLRSSAAVMNRWAAAHFGMSRASLVDHSGLEPTSRLTAQGMATALVKAHKAGVLQPILKHVAMRHKNGKENRGHPIKVFAKTGTLNFVSNLAGYIVAKDGTELAFAIFSANEGKRAHIPKADRESPHGARGWNIQAKRLQQRLIERWGALYGG
ncbi:D-alanyl-D-alanine carboxypeptidase/D-alanyl-D-alanine-endopeptidase [Aquicoccus sp. G2-2]|uniref:D-alanyl-D-alanine carboxypeptidase/D-alanyl-D-alanine endopeptidase n=1 Tax=Aquicoccus sp. G2-2 TaxID=3092120 RepID=UPI00366C5FCD